MWAHKKEVEETSKSPVTVSAKINTSVTGTQRAPATAPCRCSFFQLSSPSASWLPTKRSSRFSLLLATKVQAGRLLGGRSTYPPVCGVDARTSRGFCSTAQQNRATICMDAAHLYVSLSGGRSPLCPPFAKRKNVTSHSTVRRLTSCAADLPSKPRPLYHNRNNPYGEKEK